MPPNNYCAISEIKEQLTDVEWGTSYDALLESLAQRASRSIDLFKKRKPGAFFVNSDEIRYFTGSSCDKMWIGELAAAPTEVAVDETGTGTYAVWASTNYICWPYNALLDGLPYLRLDINLLTGAKTIWPNFTKGIKITAKFGYSAVTPDTIKQATIIQSVRWFKRGQQAFRDIGAITELGQLTFTKRLDPDVEEILEGIGSITI